MDHDLSEAADSLRRAITAAIVPLQTMRGAKKEEFARLQASARVLATALKGRDLVSKALLKEMYACIQILRNEAPHTANDRRFLEDEADKLELCFGLILEDEDHSDRKSGVPRIV
jgi:hypothetical protein